MTQHKINAYFAENKSQVRGKTVKEILAILPFKTCDIMVRLAMWKNGMDPKLDPNRGGPSGPYYLFNWNLTNKELSEAWKIPCHLIAQRRCNKKLGKSKWSNFNTDPSHLRAIRNEKIKADLFWEKDGEKTRQS